MAECARDNCSEEAKATALKLCEEHFMDSLIAANTPSGAEEYHAMKAADYAIEYGWDDE